MNTQKEPTAAELSEALGISRKRATGVLTSQAAKILRTRNSGRLGLPDLMPFVPPTVDASAVGFTVTSFFSGCGGLDLGFKQSDFHLAYANDLFGSAVLTYAKNLGHVDPRSIYEVEASEVHASDVLLAGFPCQPFSNAGSRRGKADPRGTLFWETLRFIDSRALLDKPKVVLFENVRGILSMKNEDGSNLIDAITDELRTRGYHVSQALLNASEYGVPQNRHRVIIIGLRSDLFSTAFDFGDVEKSSGLTVGDALARIEPGSQNQEHWPLSPQAQSLVKHIPEGGSWKSIPDEFLPPRLLKIKANMKRYHSPNFYRRFGADEIMGTVTAAATPENSGILHSTEDRRYTVREIATFQTFPQTFVFDGVSLQSMYKQIGNAVPVELARRLAKAIRERLIEVEL
jgi:DNA (cytosine-5)-methyltransferase 1